MAANGQDWAELKQLALQLAIQLPRDKKQALAVLQLTEHLLEGYLFQGEAELAPAPVKSRRQRLSS